MKFLLVWSNRIARREKILHSVLFKSSSNDTWATSLVALFNFVKKEEDNWWKIFKEEMKKK